VRSAQEKKSKKTTIKSNRVSPVPIAGGRFKRLLFFKFPTVDDTSIEKKFSTQFILNKRKKESTTRYRWVGGV
jgi:hypothetical protein